MNLYADVILPLPLEHTFTYSVPPELGERAKVGVRVLVPFGSRTLTGFVVGLRRKRPAGGLKLKPVAEVLDEASLFSPAFLSFSGKLSRYYLISWGEVLQAAVPPTFLLRSTALVALTERGCLALDQGALSGEEKEVASCLAEKPRSLRFLEKKCRVKSIPALLARMQKNELVAVEKEVKRVRRRKELGEEKAPAQLELDFSLDEGLQRAAAAVIESVAGRQFSEWMLFGPPERREPVYIRLIRDVLSGGGRVLYLIPEIALTPAVMEKLRRRLGEKAALLHSRMTGRQRETEWRKVKEARVEVVVGTRSALLAPVDDVRLIILDEEHDESYSQQEGLPFDIRRAAGLRAREEKAVLVYGSSMPTVENYYRAEKGRCLIDLTTASQLPRTVVVDSRKDPGVVSSRLRLAIQDRLDKKEPILLFFNRRGYASHLVCAKCGFVPRCNRCDLALSYHKREGRLVCHYCRNSVPASGTCPRCGGRLVVKRGEGVEALAEELKKLFPRIRVEVFATDEAGRKEDKERIIARFSGGDIDILAGTQLLAHQSGLPLVSLVGLLHPETVLHLADFRSGQKAYQAISRAFRFLRRGEDSEILIQTADPGHFSIREAVRGDYRAFYRQEIRYRRLLDYPPFSSLAEVVFHGENLRRVAAAARQFAARARSSGDRIKVFGPSLAPVSRIRGRHRVQVILKSGNRGELARSLRPALQGTSSKRSLVFIE